MASSAQLAQQLAKFDASRKSSATNLTDSMAQYGVPEIRSRVAGLRTTLSNTESALNNVDPSVTARTSRSLVTEGQRQRIVNQEREPIASQYGSISNTLNTESQNLNAQENAARLLATTRDNDYNVGRSALQSSYEKTLAREQAARAQANADRAFRAQQKEADRQYKLAQQAAADARKKGSGGKSSTPKTTVASLFDGYDPKKDKWYTEKVVIPTLIAELGYSKDKANKAAYDYRKAKFGE